MSSLVVDSTGNDLTYQIIGAAMTVHNHLGPGYKEEVYERALAVELQKCGIGAERQFPVPIEYEGVLVYQFMLDLFVQQTVVVEVKAISEQVGGDQVAQVINYLKATHAPVGLLINFHELVLKDGIRRIVNNYQGE